MKIMKSSKNKPEQESSQPGIAQNAAMDYFDDQKPAPALALDKTEQRRKTIINILYWMLTLLVVYFVFKYVVAYIMPFLIGFVVALLLRPFVAWVARKTKIKHSIVAVVFVVLFYSVIVVVLTLLGIRIATYLVERIQQFPAIYTKTIAPALFDFVDNINAGIQLLDPSVIGTIETIFNTAIDSLGGVLVNVSTSAGIWITNVAASLPGFLLNLAFTVISTVFIAIDYPKVTGFIMRQMPDRAQGLARDVKKYLFELVGQYVRSYALIMFITFAELTVGFFILGIKNSFLMALVIAIFDILPVVGTGTVLIPWAVICFISGNTGFGIGLLVIYFVIFIVRNIIEPKIVGDSVGLHPLVTLVSIFVGARLFGGVGLIGLPIMFAILNALNEKGAIKLFKKQNER